MFKKIGLLIVFGLLFNMGCSDSSNNTKEINRTVIEKNISKEETILNEMGFNFEDNKIIIDLNKSTNFFSQMEKKINEKSKEIENKVNIDLNKTKSKLDNLSSIFRDIVVDINASF